jgi:hypothetical protein
MPVSVHRLSRTPANIAAFKGASGVAPSAAVVFTFSTAMNPALTTATFLNSALHSSPEPDRVKTNAAKPSEIHHAKFTMFPRFAMIVSKTDFQAFAAKVDPL